MVGSAWMPCERPMVGVFLCSKARRLSALSSLSTSAIRMSAARTSCTLKQVSSTSDEVMPGVHEARLRPDDLGQMRQEGDDVVLDLALDLVDARDVELGLLALVPDFLRRGLRHDAELGHGVGGVRLDLEPDAKARLRRPDRRHFGTGIARDHGGRIG